MNSKTKIFTVLLVSVAACMLVYAPLTMAIQPSHELGEEIPFAEMEQDKSCDCGVGIKLRLLWWFLNHSEPVEIDGTVVMLSDKKLVLSSGEEQIGVHLPDEWIVDGKVVTPAELFSSGYLSEGENIAVKALRADLIDKEWLSIYLTVGYEIIDDAGDHAYVNLDVNIED